jgi:transcription antitermination factor NusG
MSKFSIGWYVIYTKPRHEKKVHAQLSEKSITSYLPTHKVLRVWNDRKKYIDEPLFSSYVFIHLQDMQNYFDSMDLEGVLYYVRKGREIARVSETIINNIKLITGEKRDLEISQEYFQPGRRMIVGQGALNGLSCEVVEIMGRQRLLVRVDLLRRNILLTLPLEYLMIIER